MMATMPMSYSCVPDRILDLGISPRAQSLFHALTAYRNRRTGLCNPRQKKLAERFGCHLRSIERAFAELQAAGMILAHRTLVGNRYELATPDRWQRPSHPPNMAGAQPPSVAEGNRHPWRVQAVPSLYEPDVLQPEGSAAAADVPTTPGGQAAATASTFVEIETEKPTPPASGSLNENPADQVVQVVRELMAVHPEPGNLPRAVTEVAKLIAGSPGEVVATLEAVRSSHAAWRVRWAEYGPGRFIPQLWRWVHDGDWRNAPAERKGMKSETWIERRKREQQECDDKTYRMYAELGAWEILREYGDDEFVEAWRAKVEAVA